MRELQSSTERNLEILSIIRNSPLSYIHEEVKKPGQLSTTLSIMFLLSGIKNLGLRPIYIKSDFLKQFLIMLLIKLSANGCSSILMLCKSSSRNSDTRSMMIL